MNVSINPRIFVACLLGSGIVGAALLYSPHAQSEGSDRALEIVPEVHSREFISVTDQDGNGIPDWQESLLDSSGSIKLSTGSSTDYQSPETLTGKMGLAYLQSYINGSIQGNDKPSDQASTDVEQLYLSYGTDAMFTPTDFAVTEADDPTTLRAYGNHIADIALKNSVPKETRNETTILSDAYTNKDEAMLAELAPIVAGYAHMTQEMQDVTVPQAYAQAHSDLTNAYNALAIDIEAMTHVFDDPFLTSVRLQRYPDDVAGLQQAIENLYLQLNQDGIHWTSSDRAAQFIVVEST